MSAESVTARGRAAAEQLMVDACVIKRVTGSTTDPNTGVITPTYATIYTGKCRVQQAAAGASPADAGEAYVLLVRRELQLPVVGSEGVRAGDEVAMTASVNDPGLLAAALRVRDGFAKTHATSRRLGVEEVTS